MADFELRTGDFDPRGFRLLILIVLICAVVAAVALFFAKNVSGGVSVLVAGIAIYVLLHTLLAVESNTNRSGEVLERLSRQLTQVEAELRNVRESILLSEDAKAIAFRDKDCQALRDAIEEELNRSNWEAATYLADQMERRFGYCQEADQLRERIHTLQMAVRQEKLSGLLARIDELLSAHEWDEASRQIKSTASEFGDAEEVKQLWDRLEQARNEHKKWLLKQWDQAVQRNEVDRGIDILKDLEPYLTAREVEALEESARGVFRAKLHNLGVQFSLLVTEKLWDKALEVGEEIVKEFPNSRMATEIRERLDALRDRAQSLEDDQQGE